MSAGNAGDAAPAPDLLEAELTDAGQNPPTVYGDAAYGTGPLLAALDGAGAVSRVKVQPANAPGDRFTKDAFAIDLTARTVTCPAGRVAPFRGVVHTYADFGRACARCPLASRCTTSPDGRQITVGPHEALLARGRAAVRDPVWRADYRATRPLVERKIAHLMRRHGGRRARVRGRQKVSADFALLAAAVNLARLAILGLVRTGPAWAVRAT